MPTRPARSQSRSSTRRHRAEVGRTQRAALEDDHLERGADQLELLEAAVREASPCQRRVAETRQVEPAVLEDDVCQRRLGELGAGQSTRPELDSRGSGGMRLAPRLWVYAIHMSRTNIDIDEELVARVMRRYGVRTKRAAVDLALRRLDLAPMTRDEALAMRGTGWEGDLSELRAGYLRPVS